MTSEEESTVKGAVFEELAKLVEEQDDIEFEVMKFSRDKLQPLYEKRRQHIAKLPRFWPTVLGASGMLDEYVNLEDLEVISSLNEVYVEYGKTSDDSQARNFTIHFEFDDNEYFAACKLSKSFEYKSLENGQSKYESKPVHIKWKKGKDLTKPKDPQEEKKKQEAEGDTDEEDLEIMDLPSFFNWFLFTGSGPGDYPDGESLALTLVDEVYPHALKFYVEAVTEDDDLDVEDEYDISGDDDEEEDGEEEEEEGEHDDAPPKKKAKN